MNRTIAPGTVCSGSATSVLPLLACSACAGDYEDPDRTARPSDLGGADETEEGEDVVVSRSSSGEGIAEAGREVSGRGEGAKVLNGKKANGDEFPATEK